MTSTTSTGCPHCGTVGAHVCVHLPGSATVASPAARVPHRCPVCEGRDTVYIVLGWFGDVEWIEGEWETGGPDRVWVQRAYRTREEATARAEHLWETRTTESPEAPDYVQKLAKFAVAELVLR